MPSFKLTTASTGVQHECFKVKAETGIAEEYSASQLGVLRLIKEILSGIAVLVALTTASTRCKTRVSLLPSTTGSLPSSYDATQTRDDITS
jgi:hypothetical protein